MCIHSCCQEITAASGCSSKGPVTKRQTQTSWKWEWAGYPRPEHSQSANDNKLPNTVLVCWLVKLSRGGSWENRVLVLPDKTQSHTVMPVGCHPPHWTGTHTHWRAGMSCTSISTTYLWYKHAFVPGYLAWWEKWICLLYLYLISAPHIPSRHTCLMTKQNGKRQRVMSRV